MPDARHKIIAVFFGVFCWSVANQAQVKDDIPHRVPSLSTHSISAYSSHLWQTEDGLPHNSVLAVTQTRDGYLWVGTQKGLARFDGMRFTSFGQYPEIKDWPVSALCETRDGTLWIGSQGGGLNQIKNGTFSHLDEGGSPRSDQVKAFFESKDGSLWIGTATGLMRYFNGKFTRFGDKGTTNVVRAICEDHAKNIWFVHGHTLSLLQGGQITTYPTNTALADLVATTLCLGNGNIVWVGTLHGLLRTVNGEGWHYRTQEGLLDNYVSALYESQPGKLWVGTRGGLNRIDGTKIDQEFNDLGKSFDTVHCIFQDREKNLWVGTSEGLGRLGPRPFTTYTKDHGLTHNNVTSVREDKAGNIWIGTWGGGLNRFKDGKFTAINQMNSLGQDFVLSTCEGHDGSLWIGIDYDGGVYRFKDGKFTHYSKEDGLIDAAVRVIHEDQSGNLWIGTSRGLSLFANGKFTSYTTKEGLAGNTVRVICEDDEGNLWIGTNEGLSRRKDGSFANFTTEDGLSQNTVVAFYEDKEKNLWIGTQGGGLNRLRHGKFTSYTTKQGLFSDDVFEILEDDYGCLWMSCLNGIFRVSKKELDDFDQKKIGRITSIAYGKADGLPRIQCNGVSKPASWKSRDGRLWFPTTKGLVVANSHIKVNNTPPPVVIEEIIADRQRVEGQTNSAIEIPPGHGELEFNYTALSLQAPEKNRFKYKLDGVDSEWMDVGTRRIAYYNNIKPGKYLFRVIGCNNDGVWNETGASLAIILQPHFWQTKWFIGLIGLSAIGLVAGTARYITWKRVQQHLLRLEHQHAVEKERTRIAQDMHDDLGAHLTEILLLSSLTKKSKANEEAVETHAVKIANVAQGVINNLHAIVWAVNPKNDSLDKLILYICDYAQSFLKLSSIRCRFDLPEEQFHYPLSSEVRHNLFLVVKEAMNNIVKHSAASEVWFRLRLENGALSIAIEDNGQGFSTAETSAFGNGLLNMEKRMRDIGGQFRLTSQPGKGTTIKLQLPLIGKAQAN